MRHGLQSIMGLQRKTQPNDASIPDIFCRCFNNNNTVSYVRASTDPEDWVISLSEGKVFNHVNTF